MVLTNINSPKVKNGQQLELEIVDLARGGAGVAKLDAVVIFVPFTMPGDRVIAKIIKQEKRFWRAELREVLRAAPGRVTPACAVFSKCGGCAWQHIPYSLQLKTKVAGLESALHRAQIKNFPAPEIFGAPSPYGYRNRIQLRGDKAGVGYFAPGSRDLVRIARCEIADPRLNAMLTQVQKDGPAQLKAQNDLYKVELEVGHEGDAVRVTYNQGHGAHGFKQVNDLQNDKMKAWIYEQVLEWRGQSKGDLPLILWDLYGGNGNLSHAFEAHFSKIITVDLTAPVSASTEVHQYVQADVAQWLSQQNRSPKEKGQRGVALVDPAREGVGPTAPALANFLSQSGAELLIAVGCDADAWARDLSQYLARGWRVKKMSAFDFFPQTPHIEAVAVLQYFGL